MKWIKFSEQKPEPGTLCLCKRKLCGYPDFSVALYIRYDYAKKGGWLIFYDNGSCAQLPDDYYGHWMPIDKVDNEASKD